LIHGQYSDYVLAQTELPNNSVNESGSTGEEIDFTNNEFLLHGLEGTVSSSIINPTTVGSILSTNTASGCATWLNSVTNTMHIDKEPLSDPNGRCRAPMMDFSLSGITEPITSATLTFDVTSDPNQDQACHIINLPTQATHSQTTFNEMYALDLASDASATCGTLANGQSISFNADGIADINANIAGSEGFYSLGLFYDSTTRDSTDRYGSKTIANSVLTLSNEITLADKSTNSVGITYPDGDNAVGEIRQTQDQTCGLERYDENNTCGQKFGTGATLNGITFDGVEWQLYKTTSGASGTIHAYVVNDSWTRDKPTSSILYDMGSMSISSITEVCSGGGATCNTGVEYASYTFTGTGGWTLGSSGSNEHVILHADHNTSGFYVGMPNTFSSSYDGTNSEQMSKWGTQALNVQTSRDLNLKFITLTPPPGLPTSTTGTIGTALQNPNLIYTNLNLPDNTDTLSLGGFVKLDETNIYHSNILKSTGN